MNIEQRLDRIEQNQREIIRLLGVDYSQPLAPVRTAAARAESLADFEAKRVRRQRREELAAVEPRPAGG